MIGENLLRFKKSQRYVFIDTETFHLNLMMDNPPWQVGWLVANIDGVIDKANHYLQWNKRFRMSEGARIVTGYQEKDIIQYGKDPKQVWDILFPLLNDPQNLIVAHNLFSFDYHILVQWSKYVGGDNIEHILPRCIDTNSIAKAIKLGLKPDNNFLAFQLKLSTFHQKGMKTSLGFLTKEYKISFANEKFHDAEFDIQANFEIFKKQIWEIEI